jgi:zinc transport system substrate-binding protein
LSNLFSFILFIFATNLHLSKFYLYLQKICDIVAQGAHMNKLVLGILFLFITSSLYAKLDVIVSVLPQKTFVEAIGGDKVNTHLMVLPGNSPHTYEPKPSQMKAISKADIYFSIDVEFENVWLPKFRSINKKMKVIDVDDGIEKIAIGEHEHDEHEEHHDEEKEHEHEEHHEQDKQEHHHHGGLDPHIWTSPDNVKTIAKNIYNALVQYDKANKAYYTKNYKQFLNHIKKTDKTIQSIFKETKDGAKFMVFHPAWGYFAKQYHLEQFAIEVEGKNPKPKQIKYLIHEAKEEDVKAIFTAPEFSQKVAKQIARELHIPVLKVSPLNPKWSQNLINLAKAIANK